jgi:hypothetical protein
MPAVETHRETPLNINLNINNERQDCKIGIVCWGVTYGRGVLAGGGRCTKEIKVRYMVDGLHTLI